ncbi:MAG: septal ring lytic transglycosylase RlpA family protein [candidate division KSB1 bacterium]|nr:septal ring lytic transglycosylase RlpA family protein [candidate division KSB1 bacterium]
MLPKKDRPFQKRCTYHPTGPCVSSPPVLRPGEEPAEWLKKFMQRVKKAREEVRRKAMEHLRGRSKTTLQEIGFLNIQVSPKRRQEPRQPTVRRSSHDQPQARRPRRQSIEEGIASFYGKRWNGRKTANGEIFNDEKYTAAHKTLPFGTFVRVVRKDNGRSVVVRINDRGPFKPGRIIDLSTAGARRLGMLEEGLVEVAIYPATLVDFLKQFERQN